LNVCRTIGLAPQVDDPPVVRCVLCSRRSAYHAALFHRVAAHGIDRESQSDGAIDARRTTVRMRDARGGLGASGAKNRSRLAIREAEACDATNAALGWLLD